VKAARIGAVNYLLVNALYRLREFENGITALQGWA
jgi:hypothetical protein